MLLYGSSSFHFDEGSPRAYNMRLHGRELLNSRSSPFNNASKMSCFAKLVCGMEVLCTHTLRSIIFINFTIVS